MVSSGDKSTKAAASNSSTASSNSNLLKDAAKVVGSKDAAQPTSTLENTSSTSTAKPKNEGTSETGNTPRQPDFRFKHYIRVKIGGDSTGTLPPADTPTKNPLSDPQLLEALKKAGGTQSDIKSDAKTQATTNSSSSKTDSASPKTNSSTLGDAQKTNSSTLGNAQKTNSSTPGNTQKTNSSTPGNAQAGQLGQVVGAPNNSALSKEQVSKVGSNTLKDGELLEQFGDIIGSIATTDLDPQSKAEDLPRELIFDSREGHFMGRSEIRSSTSQHSTAKFCLVDPEDKYREILGKLRSVEVTVGFVNGYKRNIFVGEIRDIGRKLPGGTLIIAIDPTASKLQGTTSAATVTADPLAAAASPTAATPDNSSKVIEGAATAGSSDLAKKNAVYDAALAISPQGAATPTAGVKTPTTAANTPTAGVKTPTTAANTPATAAKTAATATDLVGLISPAPKQQSLAKIFTEATDKDLRGLKFSDRSNNQKIERLGQVQLQQAAMGAMVHEAALQGNVIAVRGNTVEEVSPGNAQSSGVVLDYLSNRDAFIGHPTITRRSPVQLQGGGGFAVRGWNPLTKQVTEGVAYTPAPVMQHPTGVINAPEWGAIKLSDPIIPGSPYTWGDATKNGSRVPKTKEIMGGIIRICKILTDLTTKAGQKKFTVNSWYRDPISNRQVGGASDSRHLYGDAIDFYFSGPGYVKLFQELWADGPSGSGGWPGGVAKGNGFIHIDDRGSQGRGRSRWYYPGAR